MAKKKEKVDIVKNIDSPKHYCNETGYEVIHVLQDWKMHFHRNNVNKGKVFPANLSVIGSGFNVVKYLMRAGKKDLVAQELGKVVYYMKEIKDYLDGYPSTVVYEITHKKYSVEKVIEDFELSKEVGEALKLFKEGNLEKATKKAEKLYTKAKKAL